MPPLAGVVFQVEVPRELVDGKGVFKRWLRKRGQLQSEDTVGTNWVFIFDTRKCVRKDALLISLQTAFTKSGLLGGANALKLTTLKVAASNEPSVAKLATEITELRKLVHMFCTTPPPPLTVNGGADQMKNRLAQREATLSGLKVDNSESNNSETETDDASDTSSYANSCNANITREVKAQMQTRKISAYVRQLVWNQNCGERNGLARCWCCDITTIGGTSGWDCGHIVAKSRGGSDDIDNLRPICRGCNSAMGTENMLDFQRRHFGARHAMLF